MALTPEQQAQLEFETALEATRSAASSAHREQNTKLETLRIAKELLIENRRVKSAAEVSDIDEADVTNFAAALTAFVNS